MVFPGLFGEGLFDPLIQPSQSVDLDKETHKLFRPQRYGIRSHAPAIHGVPSHTHLLSQFRRGDFQFLENGFEFFRMPDGRIEYRNVGRVQGGESQPMSQERRHGGGQQGRASVTGSPASGGMHSLIGAIDIALLLRYFSG